jgi:hypothetical protein
MRARVRATILDASDLWRAGLALSRAAEFGSRVPGTGTHRRATPLGASDPRSETMFGTHLRSVRLVLLLVVFLGTAVTNRAYGAGYRLERIRFPAGFTATTGTMTPPVAAPLSQTVVFEFGGEVKKLQKVIPLLRIRVDGGNTLGQPIDFAALGEFTVEGKKIVFRPRLPSDALPEGFAPSTDLAQAATLPGLLPATIYAIDLDPDLAAPGFKGVKASQLTLPVRFTTTAGLAGPLFTASLYANAPPIPPQPIAKSIKPKPGITGLHPNPFEDPAGLFSSIPAGKRPPFRIKWKGPLYPGDDNLGAGSIRLRAIRDASGAPIDLPLAVETVLTANDYAGATLYVYPLAILPFGYTIALEVSEALRSLSGTAAFDGQGTPEFLALGEYVVAPAPGGNAPIEEILLEDFDTIARFDASTPPQDGFQLAAWDAADSNVLRATFGFGGDGSLGKFQPPAIDQSVIELDTDFQAFPLLSGSTPDAVPGTMVKGGVFHFTSFHLPPNVTLRARGSNPLVVTCTGDFICEGMIDVRGADGGNDDTFDSAIFVVPGGTAGPGGGAGGDGHPVVAAASGVLAHMQTPQFAASGQAPGLGVAGGGGGGGQMGCTLPWSGFDGNCLQFGATADGSRGAGGGGGSFAGFLPLAPESVATKVSGRRGAIGIGNHLPIAYDPTQPLPAAPSAYDGVTANAVATPNPNPTFAEAYQAGLVADDPQAGNPLLLDLTTSFATSRRALLPGAAGPAVFADGDPENDFIGEGGELMAIRGGQGGGGGGSRTEGLDVRCIPVVFAGVDLPLTVLDARGGGGGGGGGALLVQALGTIEFRGNVAFVDARGGRGGGGEEVGFSSRGGGGGGGAGGAVILQSAGAVVMNDPSLPLTVIDVSPGCGASATLLSANPATGTPGGESFALQVGDGGPGGPGLVQIHAADVASVDASRIAAMVNVSLYNVACTVLGPSPGLASIAPLVPFAKTPTPLTSHSVGRSTWVDLGAITVPFREPIATSAGPLDPPIFGIPAEGPFFTGTDPLDGFVATDPAGFVVDPFANDFQIDAPDLALSDFLPNGPVHYQRVKIEFQGADEDAANPGLPDLATATAWTADATLLNGRRFVRTQVTFDIAAAPAAPPTLATPRPQMNFLRLPFRY